MRMSPEDENNTGEEDEEEEEGGEDDADDSDSPQANTTAANGEVVMSTDTFLDLLYLATRSNSQNARNGNSESMNWEDCDGSYGSVNCSDEMESDCDCNDSDAYTDSDYDEDGDVEIILEEIRRISEALLGSTMSELVDAERRISLKSFDELAARDESVSSIMDEWDYEDSEVTENDDCQGVVERIQLFMRPLQRDGVSGNVLRDLTERSLFSRSAHRNGRYTTNPIGGSVYVVFFDPTKVGVFPKFTSNENPKAPRLKRVLPMKKALPQRVRFDKDSVRRWSEDDEKEEIARRRLRLRPALSVGGAGAGAGAGSKGRGVDRSRSGTRDGTGAAQAVRRDAAGGRRDASRRACGAARQPRAGGGGDAARRWIGRLPRGWPRRAGGTERDGAGAALGRARRRGRGRVPLLRGRRAAAGGVAAAARGLRVALRDAARAPGWAPACRLAL